jgi:hypothetical protein
VKKFFPWKFNLEYDVPLLSYSCVFQVEICSQQLEICKSVCMFIVLRHCCGDWLTFGCFVPMIANHDLVKKFWSDDCQSWPREEKFWSDDCRSWPREEKINNHGCWGKHAHIPDNDYWGICLFHVVWTNYFFAIILMWYTRNIF